MNNPWETRIRYLDISHGDRVVVRSQSIKYVIYPAWHGKIDGILLALLTGWEEEGVMTL